MRRPAVRTFDEPLGDLNTTPLIDVLLVLLILFVITIPPAYNALEIPLPGNEPGPAFDRLRNRVEITPADALLWNGEPVSAADLASVLATTTHVKPEPELQFEPDPNASYDRAAEVMQIIRQSGVSRFGFVGNERYAEFGKPTP